MKSSKQQLSTNRSRSSPTNSSTDSVSKRPNNSYENQAPLISPDEDTGRRPSSANMRKDTLDDANQKPRWENLAFEGGGAKGISYVGVLKVNIYSRVKYYFSKLYFNNFDFSKTNSLISLLKKKTQSIFFRECKIKLYSKH